MRAFGGGQRAMTPLSSEWDSASVSRPCSHQAYLQGSVTLFSCRGKPIAEKLSSTPRMTQLISDQSEISLPSWRKEEWVPQIIKVAGNQYQVGNASSQMTTPGGRSQTVVRWVGRWGRTWANRAREQSPSGGMESCAFVSVVGFPSA